MSVRFDASGEHYTRSLSLGGVAQWTVTCWARLAVNRGTTTVLWQIDSNSATGILRLNAWDGSDLTFETDGSAWFGVMGHDMVVGEWTFIGMSGIATPGQVRYAVRSGASGTWVSGDLLQSDVAFNANTIRLGNSDTTDWFNGSLANVKVWSTSLTVEELQAEAAQAIPRRTQSMVAWYPLITGPTTDYYGLGGTLSGGSGAVLDDGPPLTWSTGLRRIHIPAATATPKSLTDTGTGTDAVSVAADVTLTDTSTAADALTASVDAAGLSDTVIADDALSVAVTLTLAEAVAGTDDFAAGVPIDLTDAGTGLDDLTSVPTPMLDEPVVGSDALSISTAADLTETVSAADALVAVELIPKPLDDTVGAVDDLTLVVFEDLDFVSLGLRRGWTAIDPARAWDSNTAARGWAAGTLTI